MSIIIHCGGLGIAFKAAYHGIPQIIIPKKFEEPFWAQKIRELGCGDFIEFKNLTSKNLNSVVNNVLNNIMIKHNATMLSQSINIDGVKNTYEYLKI